MSTLRTLLTTAEDLRVDAIAQEPFCAEPARRSPADTYVRAIRQGFDTLPIRDDDGHIRRVIPTTCLSGATTWTQVLDDAIPLDADALVARDAPVFSVLERLAASEVLFTLGRQGVDGVVTVFDLNQPAAHLFGFGLVLIAEDEITEVIRAQLGEDAESAAAGAEHQLGRGRMGLKRWRRARDAGKELHVAATLTFGEKLELLPAYGGNRLASRLGTSPEELLDKLGHIKELRDALAHYDDADRLADPRWVLDRMRLANSLVAQLGRSATAS